MARWDLVRHFLRCGIGAVAPLTAMLLVPLAGAAAYAVEVGSWQYMHRAAQNAADGAALAAATVASGTATTGTTSQLEARAAAQKLGFTNGASNTTVTAGVTACPAGVTGPCYEAIVTTTMPVGLARVLGYTGTGTTGNQLIVARAIADATGGGGGSTSANPCLWALGNSGVTLQGNGIPSANLAGCGVVSAGGILCNGSATMNADFALAGSGTSSGCAGNSNNDIDPSDANWVAPPADPYIGLSVPAAPVGSPACSDNPPEVMLSSDPVGPNLYYCGNVKLTKNINLTGSNTVMVINNGSLDLNGYTLKTSGEGASATIVFTGTNAADRQHYPTSSKANQGTLEIKAPTAGTWANIALYQDRNLTNHKFSGKDTVHLTYAGNQPTWNIAGVVYFPSSATTFSGIVGKYESNVSCFVIIANTILINGTGEIIASNTTDDCVDSGYTIPTVTVAGAARPKLVL